MSAWGRVIRTVDVWDSGNDNSGTGMAIPVVDFHTLSDSTPASECPVIKQLHSAFSTLGFVFITNHGIDMKLVDQAFEASREFFSLPEDQKRAYSTIANLYSGYIGMGMEDVDPTKASDLKECFNMCEQQPSNLPSTYVLPSFKPMVTELYDCLSRLSLRILELMGHGLKLKDPQFFVNAHQKIRCENDQNFTTLRLLHYPALPPERKIGPGQLRCGEHRDYGSITLLFQDPTGGLQVKCSDGSYVDVPYMRDAVLVNLGAHMQKWTADVYRAALHRVPLPADGRRGVARHSMVFFVHPDNDVVVECLDGSDKYPASTAVQDTLRRLEQTYSYTSVI